MQMILLLKIVLDWNIVYFATICMHMHKQTKKSKCHKQYYVQDDSLCY